MHPLHQTENHSVYATGIVWVTATKGDPVLHPRVTNELAKSIRDERLAFAARERLASTVDDNRGNRAAADFQTLREARVIRFGREYTRELGDLLAA